MRKADEANVDPTDMVTLLPLDTNILGWYNMPINQAEYLINFFQFQFSYGNSFIRNALLALTYSLINRMNEQHVTNNENTSLRESNKHLSEAYRELELLNESLAADAQALPAIQVPHPSFV